MHPPADAASQCRYVFPFIASAFTSADAAPQRHRLVCAASADPLSFACIKPARRCARTFPSVAAPMPQRAVYQCSEEGAAVCSGDVSMQKAADDERANTATPSPQALRHRQQCSRRSSRARRAKTGGQQRSATTRKFSETCLSTRADKVATRLPVKI